MDFLIHHLLQSTALKQPEKEALVHKKQRLTYKEVAQKTTSFAWGLRNCGLQPGDRLGIYLDASIPQVISILGTSQAGGVFVPINTLLFPEQVLHIANDCQIRGLITTARKLSSLDAVIPDISSLKFVIVVAESEIPPTSVPSYDFKQLCQLELPSDWQDLAIDRDLAALIYTSGSTGKPKGVMLNHAQIMAGSSIVSQYLKITESDRILAVLPFSFDAGLNQLITAFQQGSTLVLISFSFAREVVQILIKEKITALAGVPTFWGLMIQPRSSMAKQQFPHLRYITNTGGKMPQNVLATLRTLLPKTEIFLMYGLTEAFRSTYLPPEQLDLRPNSIGKAIPNTEILVVNDQGQPCKPGEIGELVHRGPTVSLGYWGQPELTAQRLRDYTFQLAEIGNQEKVCYSGDLVKMDEEGFFYFISRRDTMIKSSGFRISPTEVEEVLMASNKLQSVAVIGIPDDLLGQAIKAFVVKSEGIDLDVESLLGFCTTKLPRYAIPKQVEILSKLPQTTSGKVDYAALRERENL
jgi:acyl-CoA ligase (AMP-forming) (exosortase A-associated)